MSRGQGLWNPIEWEILLEAGWSVFFDDTHKCRPYILQLSNTRPFLLSHLRSGILLCSCQISVIIVRKFRLPVLGDSKLGRQLESLNAQN